eukprot:CAMPEP_0181334424 /NCGR_PEP_ID=MMETSP1101-20121128/26246_1 /TAXON_ID=46948 /ORGANISM="Rhodomonas abbreviata, Strain Caron Lab Isolate" /LENGTH=131 /DNA_ID=CAMNT_0023444387 /DNA_START=234 /DNA_END=626 /DNA_ORIENTATION=-
MAGEADPDLPTISSQDAIQIFALRSRATCGDNPEHQFAAGRSAVVCEMFNVDAKLVRDIWTRKAYGEMTEPFWTDREKLLNACDQFRSGGPGPPPPAPAPVAPAGGGGGGPVVTSEKRELLPSPAVPDQNF